MKKRVLYFAAFAFVIALLAVSCTKSETEFDKALLIGEWQSGTLHEKYLEGGTGSSWDTGDDVTEEEAMPFTWTLDGSNLQREEEMFDGSKVVKYYTVLRLTYSTLEFTDDFDVSSTFTKVP
jgi:hypothetical protein